MNYLCVEISHKSLNLDKLQAVLPNEDQVNSVYNDLIAVDKEVFILRTCFRLLIFTKNICKLSLDSVLAKLNIEEKIDFYTGDEAVEHLFKIACGLDSPFLGEGEILAQVKKSFELAQQKMAVGPFLQQIIKSAIFTGKKVRSETSLGRTSNAYASIAAGLLKNHFENLQDKQILIAGTGKLGVQLYNNFNKKTNQPILIYSANDERLNQFCSSKTAIPYPKESAQIKNCDIILAASNNLKDVSVVSSASQVIIDFGMPANIKNNGKGYYIGMEKIKTIQQQKNEEKKTALPQVNKIIQQELEVLNFWLKSRAVVPIIKNFKAQAEQIKQEEWDWAKNKLGNLSDSQVEVIQKMINRIAGRLTNKPMAKIKAFAQDEQSQPNIKAFKEIFDL